MDLRYSQSPVLVYRALRSPSSIALPHDLRERIDRAPAAKEQIARLRILNIDFFPRESHLVTFRDPWSFLMLFHPACNQLVRKHMDDLSQKVAR